MGILDVPGYSRPQADARFTPTAFDPAKDLRGIVFRVRTDSLTGTSGSAVTKLADISGNGKDLVVRSGATTPTISATGLNGRKTAAFSSSATLQNATFATWPQDSVPQPITVFAVAKYLSTGPSAQQLLTATTGTSFGLGGGLRPVLNAGNAVEGGGPPLNDDQWHVFAWQMLGGSCSMFVDGRLVGVFTTQAQGANGMSGGIAAASTFGAPTSAMTGELAELIVSRSSEVTLQTIGKLSAWLATDWGLTPGNAQSSVTWVDATLSNGQLCRIFTQTKVPTSTGLVILNHQQGGSYAYAPNTTAYPAIHELVNAGYVVAVPNNYGADSWSNDNALATQTATRDYVHTNVAKVTGTVLLGLSMGGCLSAIAATTAANVLPDLKGVYLEDAAVSLHWMYQNAYATSINTGFGISAESSIPAAKDPVSVPASGYRTGLRWRFMSSPNDTTVSKANCTDVLVPIVTSASPLEVTSLTHTGAHLHKYGVWPKDVVDFVNRCLS